MRLKSIFFLVIFSSFLVAPAVLTLAKLQVDVNTYFSMTEEETSDSYKVGPKQKDSQSEDAFAAVFAEDLEAKEGFYYNATWQWVYSETHSPPPELLLS